MAKPGELVDASMFFGNAFMSEIENVSGASLESVGVPTEAIEFTVVSDSMPPSKAPSTSESESLLKGLQTGNQVI